MIKYPAGALAIVLILAGCGVSSTSRGSGTPAPLPVPSGSSIRPNDIKKGTWIIVPDSRPQLYSSTLTTLIFRTDSSNIRQDTLTSKTKFTISQTRTANGISWTGSIIDFSLQSSTPLQDSSYESLRLPLLFSETVTNHQLEFTTNRQSDQGPPIPCNDLSRTPLSVIQRNSFVLPIQLTAGQNWEDSVTSIVCAGSLPLSITTIRSYQVIGSTNFEGIETLAITQSERTFSRGEGSQGQHRILVEGSATTTRLLNVDRVSGNLFASKATTKTSLAIQASGKIQNFTQLSSEITTRSNSPY